MTTGADQEGDETITDGVVTLRPFDERDIDAHVAGDDDEIRYWFDAPGASTRDGMAEVVERWRREREAGTRLTFAVVHDGTTVGVVEARPHGETASLSWTVYAGQRGQGYATRATRLLIRHAYDHLGVRRVQAEVDPRNKASQRVATRSGLRREGLQRLEPGMADRPDAPGMVIYGGLVSDPPITEPEGFRALLNSFLPRKRAISQLLVRDHEGRVLICQLTYKRDWDLPGGVVEVGESPQLCAGREVQEELALDLPAGPLLLTDWLPPWGGWDDAVCLVFDGGEHDAALLDGIEKEAREIRSAEFATLEQVRERCADFTARRIESALANVGGAGPAYVESGKRPSSVEPVETTDAGAVVSTGSTDGSEDRSMTYVYEFTAGDKDQKELLGGKGANLAEMTNLGLPVPPGFTISTEACRAYLEAGDLPDGLAGEIDEHLASLEKGMGRRLGEPGDPLLVSVRSGAAVSMPGMMETVLNVGLNDESVRGLAEQSSDERFAMDSYRRLLQMFGATVLGIDAEVFAKALDRLKKDRGTESDTDLGVDDLRGLVETFKQAIQEHAGRDFPQDPREQLELAMRAVFDSWNTERAVLYRRQERIAEGLGTAVNVQAMVFGNRGDDSGSGVAFTRDPASGNQGVYGDYLQNAQGEDVVAGIRNTVSLADMERIDRKSHDELLAIMEKLEKHYRDMCDIEFTVERGKLWMLQTRVGKRTPEAAFRIGRHMSDEGLIDTDESLRRVTGAQLAQLMFPRFDEKAERTLLATGMNASPGAAVGKAVFDSDTAVEWAERGEDVILVRKETNPDDLRGMVAARGILTSRGGKTSHAAVVARGMGRTCVCGAEALDVSVKKRRAKVRGADPITEGDVISIDGTTGEVFRGAVPVTDSVVMRYLEGERPEDDLVTAVDRVMSQADGVRRLRVRANADTPEDAARARRFGAEGIGLCRTEHMFLGERRQLVENLIVAEDEAGQEAALAELLPLQRDDFRGILEAMDGLPVTIRLIDPPLHEFLPDYTELSVKVALEEDHESRDERDERLLDAVKRLHEQNPMLGLRGVRLGIVIPGLFKMQVRAIFEAAADRIAAGGDPRPEIMIPLVASVTELDLVKGQVAEVAASVEEERSMAVPHQVGTMIELPRAAVTANEIAKSAEFFSFGTNDLTQMTWGFSRDDVESSFFSRYLEHGIFQVSPFESLDVDGVGRLVRHAARLGRQANPDLHLGVCGEHGGDPASIHFFDATGLDYVSCSPFRVPVARLEAGRSALGTGSDATA